MNGLCRGLADFGARFAMCFVLVCIGCQPKSELRATFDRIRLGSAMPSDLALPTGATLEERGDVWRAVLRPKGGDMYDSEGVAVLRGAGGRVEARHYWRSDEDVILPLLLLTANTECDWEFSRGRLAALPTTQPAADGNASLLSAMAAEGERLDGQSTALRAVVRAAKADAASEKFPLDVTTRSSRSQFGYSEHIERTIREVGEAIRVTDSERYEASMLVWSLSGWHHALTHGGKIE